MKTVLVVSLIAVVYWAAQTVIVEAQEGNGLQQGEQNRSEEKRFRALRAFRRRGSNKSDEEMDAHLERVKSALSRRNGRIQQNIASDTKAKKEVKPNPPRDNIVGMPKTINELNTNFAEYLFEGDIALTPEHLATLDIEMSGRRKRKTASYVTLWPTAAQGVIPYSLDANLTAEKVSVVLASMQFWEDNTCLNFEPATPASTNGLHFANEDGCWSYIGMVQSGGLQPVSVGDGCQYFGIVTHEIGHALGFYHEQSRFDRDSYVQINYQYIQPGQQYNFVMAQTFEMSPFTTPYDYGSVMHYSSDSFTSNEAFPTITALNSAYQQTMGQGKGPSFYDVREINDFYQCSAPCAASATVCQNGGYHNPKDCTQCKCPSGFAGQVCDTIQPAENAICGGILPATTTPQTLTAPVGTPDLSDPEQTCYWHITSDPGTAVQITVTAIAGACMKGCFWNFLELKMGHSTGLINGINVQSPFEGVGYRFCCATDNLNVPFTSVTNLVPVIAYGDSLIQFSIVYQQVAAIPTTAAPPT